MGKALMVGARNQGAAGLSNGQECNFFGTNGFSGAEGDWQFRATEACTFSNLHGNIISGGGDASNTFQFRKNGANGNQSAQRTGAGAFSDQVNSDVLAANDLFNITVSEASVTDPLLAFVAAVVEFSSGHGNFHASSANSIILDVDSSTRFLNLAGTINSDGAATESDVQQKNRAYTSWEALQVLVQGNARTSTTTFRSRINAGNGGLQCDFGAGATGLVVDTSPADTLSAGDLINVSVTLGTGAAEDLVMGFVGGTFKSTNNKSHVWAGSQSGLARTASATATPHPVGGALAGLTGSTEANSRVTPSFVSTCSHLTANVPVNTYTGNSFVRLLKNGVAAITLTISAGQTGIIENTTDTVEIDDTDELSYEIDEGSSGSATFRGLGLMFTNPTGPSEDVLMGQACM